LATPSARSWAGVGAAEPNYFSEADSTTSGAERFKYATPVGGDVHELPTVGAELVQQVDF
jgi:hypothetical protein